MILAAFTAECSASSASYLVAPNGPLCNGFFSLLSYTGQHAALAAGAWLLVFAAAWLAVGPKLLRPRQNLSTKIWLLVKAALTGIAIDTAVSLYLLVSSAQESGRSAAPLAVATSLALRTAVYLGTFAVISALGLMLGQSQRSVVTPPPRFGRE